jgi:microcystin-dependent protein
VAEPFIGQISIFAGTFAPRGWAFCDGQLLSIPQNTALFSLMGNTYGGDGRSNFALPDLRGRGPLGSGQGPGLSQRPLGQSGGTQSVTLTQAQMPGHAHAAQCSSVGDGGSSPAATIWGKAQGDTPYVEGPNAVGTNPMSPAALANSGGGQPHNNMPPFLALNFIIALQGVFPPRG